MTGVYAYCVTTGECREGPKLAGVGEALVFLHPRRSLTFWMSSAPRAPEPSVTSVRMHNTVVEAAWTRCDACVPFRFGQWFASADAADEAVEERWESLAAALERVRGAGEFGVRIVDPTPDPGGPAVEDPAGGAPAEGGGTAYMQSLRRRAEAGTERRRRGEAIRQEILEALGDLVVEERSSPPASGHSVADLAHLVRRGREERYRAVLDEVRSGHPDLRFLVTGPWPPYSFGS